MQKKSLILRCVGIWISSKSFTRIFCLLLCIPWLLEAETVSLIKRPSVNIGPILIAEAAQFKQLSHVFEVDMVEIDSKLISGDRITFVLPDGMHQFKRMNVLGNEERTESRAWSGKLIGKLYGFSYFTITDDGRIYGTIKIGFGENAKLYIIQPAEKSIHFLTLASHRSDMLCGTSQKGTQ